jgi:hypothetical protein
MSRNLDFRNEKFHSYTQALGELTLAWNDFHMTLSSVFWASSKIPNGMVPGAMWNSLKSDRAQREMLAALVDLKVIGHNMPKNVRSEIKWILEKANSLEDLRNDALHSPLHQSEDGRVFAWYQLGNKRAKKLANKDLLKEFNWFYDTVLVLREYADALTNVIRRPNETFPERPQLPNRGSPSDKS